MSDALKDWSELSEDLRALAENLLRDKAKELDGTASDLLSKGMIGAAFRHRAQRNVLEIAANVLKEAPPYDTTDERLYFLNELLSKATPGPWVAKSGGHPNDWCIDAPSVPLYNLAELRGQKTSARLRVGDDARLIEYLRNAMPSLIRDVMKERDEFKAKAENLTKLLETHEWSCRNAAENTYCPSCCDAKKQDGSPMFKRFSDQPEHAPDCPVAAALKKKE